MEECLLPRLSYSFDEELNTVESLELKIPLVDKIRIFFEELQTYTGRLLKICDL